LSDLDDARRQAIAAAARRRVFQSHTLDRRALELERYVAEARGNEEAAPGPEAREVA
jgi:hypothetical protein